MVRFLTVFVTLFGGLTASATAQYLLPQKDLSFAQVAAGPTIESVLTLTNRGPYEKGYNGSLRLTQGPDGVPWNPLINGERVTNGRYAVTVEQDDIVTLHITDDTLAVGQALLGADDTYLDNFIEGTLTYFVRSGDTITDSVGVGPGQEFYLASLPFDNFRDIGLALANAGSPNPDDTPPDAQASVTLLNPSGEIVATRTVDLVPGAQSAQFLYQLFDGVQGIQDLTVGKIEIASLTPIVGTALTQVNLQISSLPLNPAPVAYDIQMTSDGDGGDTFDGMMALWVEGYFVKGYLKISHHNQQVLDLPSLVFVHGQLAGRYLDLSFFSLSENFFGSALQGVEMSLYFGVSDFGLESSNLSGDWVNLYIADRSTEGGTLSLTRITP
ncbi:MAG: hypothetical protein WAO20_14180 [Acidobacteriota bacterium]